MFDNRPVTDWLPITRKEVEILAHISQGESNIMIADVMHISKYTVKTHIYNIFKKLNVSNRLQAASWFHEHTDIKTNSETGIER